MSDNRRQRCWELVSLEPLDDDLLSISCWLATATFARVKHSAFTAYRWRPGLQSRAVGLLRLLRRWPAMSTMQPSPPSSPAQQSRVTAITGNEGNNTYSSSKSV